MTPSPDDLPPGLSSMWRLCKLGYRNEPWLLLAAFVLALLAALPDALLALWLKLLGEGAIAHDRTLLLGAAIGLGVSATATWFLRTVSTRVQRRFRDKVTIALESHVARLQASVATIAHHERPDYLDRLAVLRDQVFVLDHMYMSLFSTCGWILRLAVTVGLLMTIHPALALLAVFALPTVLTATWRPAVERAAQERGAQANRLARHLYVTATTAPPGKEVRVTGIGPRLVAQRRAAWEKWYGPIAAARWGTAVWNALAWAVFGLAYVGAVVFVSSVLKSGPGAVLLVLAAGARLSMYIGATVGEIGFLRGIWLDGAKRLAWLEDYAASIVAQADLPAPDRLRQGIRFEHVSFAYPGTKRLVLDDVTLDLPSGTVVAIVGENGAGKSTLVKLLAKLYEPTSGRITIDGADLRRMPAEAWRTRISARATRLGSATCHATTTNRRSSPRSAAPARAIWSSISRPVSRRSSAQPGPAASKSPSASGRSWRWRAPSCVITHCCSFSTSRPPRSTRKPSTPCSSATRSWPAATAAPTTAGSLSWCHTASPPCAWPT